MEVTSGHALKKKEKILVDPLHLEIKETHQFNWQNALSAEALSLGLRYEQISSTEAYTQLYQMTVEQGQKMIDMGAQ